MNQNTIDLEFRYSKCDKWALFTFESEEEASQEIVYRVLNGYEVRLSANTKTRFYEENLI